MTGLALAGGLLALVSLWAVAHLAGSIADALETIGSGGQSSLAKITWGLRAIEVETGHLPTEVTALNTGLMGVLDLLRQTEQGLADAAEAATRQEAYRR